MSFFLAEGEVEHIKHFKTRYTNCIHVSAHVNDVIVLNHGYLADYTVVSNDSTRASCIVGFQPRNTFILALSGRLQMETYLSYRVKYSS